MAANLAFFYYSEAEKVPNAGDFDQNVRECVLKYAGKCFSKLIT